MAVTQRRHSRHPALSFIKAALFLIVVSSLGNFSELIIPAASSNAQQFVSLAMWCFVLYASIFAPRILRISLSAETFVVLAFFGFAALSIGWSNYSSASFLKGLALVITTFGAYRLAITMPIDDIIDAVIWGLVVLILASVLLVAFVPKIGLDQTWMHKDQWQGIFESKQSLGSAGAL